MSTVQERLTKQIAVAITEALQPTGVGVIIEATYVSHTFYLKSLFFLSPALWLFFVFPTNCIFYFRVFFFLTSPLISLPALSSCHHHLPYSPFWVFFFSPLFTATCVWWCVAFKRWTVQLLPVQCWEFSGKIQKPAMSFWDWLETEEEDETSSSPSHPTLSPPVAWVTSQCIEHVFIQCMSVCVCMCACACVFPSQLTVVCHSY